MLRTTPYYTFQAPVTGQQSTAHPDIQQYCRTIFERSLTPFEKLGNEFECPQAVDDATLSYYLSYWSKVLNPKGQTGRLERFFTFENLSADDIRRLLSPVRLRAGLPLPEWCQVLAEVISTTTSGSVALSVERQIPFQELIAPYIGVLRSTLKRECPTGLSLLQKQAQIQMEQVLLKRIGFIFSTALQTEFRSFKEQYCEKHQGSAPDNAYHAFIAQLRADGLRRFFDKYPMLARISCSGVLLFAQSVSRFLHRLVADQQAIAKHFGAPQPLGLVAEFRMDISDQHRGGEAVVIITFESGFKVVYKPRDFQINQAYQGLCNWLNQYLSVDLKTANILNREGYGWMEFIANTECEDQAAVERYYQRAGALLAVTYLLGSTDYHAENLLAAGEYPVIIDHETLLQPTYQYETAKLSPEQRKNLEVAHHSVLRAHLLPMTSQIGKLKTDVISGFGGTKGETGFDMPAPRFVEVNTDQMRLEMQTMRRDHTENLPHWQGKPQFIDQYADHLIRGFREAYAILVSHKTSLEEPSSPLKAFGNIELRFIFRPTEVYNSILNNLLRPPYLSDATKYGLRLELIARAFLTKAERPRYWHVHRQDRQEMLNRDIPYYNVNSSSGILSINDHIQIDNYFAGSCIDNMYEKVRKLGTEDLDFQIEIINNALQGTYTV